MRIVIAEHEPDLAILDVRMPPTHSDEGLRAAIALRKERPNFPVLVLSQYVEERFASELIAAETSGLGYLLVNAKYSLSWRKVVPTALLLAH